MQQVAAIDDVFNVNPEWQGDVTGIIINQSGADSGLERCGGQTLFPVVQDNVEGDLWTALGAAYNNIFIFDRQGILVDKISPANFPEAATELETIINGLL